MLRVISESCAGCDARRVGFCSSLSDRVVEQIVGVSRTLRFRKSHIVAQNDNQAMTALVLRTGMLKVSHALTDGRQQIVDFLTDGDILIHHAADNTVFSTIEATTDVEACEVSLANLEAFCARSPEVARLLLGAVLGEINRKNWQVMMLGRKRADERVASLLLDFSDRAARRGEPAEILSLPMSRAEIADYLSLTTETVSRAFSLLKKQRIVRLPKPHDVVVCDIAGLIEIARGGANLSVR